MNEQIVQVAAAPYVTVQLAAAITSLSEKAIRSIHYGTSHTADAMHSGAAGNFIEEEQ